MSSGALVRLQALSRLPADLGYKRGGHARPAPGSLSAQVRHEGQPAGVAARQLSQTQALVPQARMYLSTALVLCHCEASVGREGRRDSLPGGTL
jgi:hypothetical protein